MISPYIDSLLQIFTAHPYIILFAGLLFAGEAFLLPAVYFALAGELRLSYIIAIAFIATAVSDLFWYYIGTNIKEKFAERLVAGRVWRALEKLSSAFSRHGGKVLYLSKFVYGTRTAAQVLAGLQAMPVRRYIAINSLGIMSLLAFIIILAYSVEMTVANVQRIVHDVEVTFFSFVAVVVLGHLVVGAYVKKIWSQ